MHTGGVQEMELQKADVSFADAKIEHGEFASHGTTKTSDAQAKASGTGQYAVQAAIQRAQLAKAQQALQPSRQWLSLKTCQSPVSIKSR